MKAPTIYNKRRDNSEWYTPLAVIRCVHETLGHISLDPASCAKANEIVHADKFYSIEDSALDQSWFAQSIYLNPPYSRGLIKRFVDKFCAEYKAGHIDAAIVLTNATPDTCWFQALAELCTGAVFTRDRIHFMRPDGTLAGVPTCGQCFFYFGCDAQKFFAVFSDIGYPVTFAKRNSRYDGGYQNRYHPFANKE